MSSRRRRKTSRTRRLGGTEAQQRQAAEASVRFWHGGGLAPAAGGQPGSPADSGDSGPTTDAAATPDGPDLGSDDPRISVTPDPTSTVRSLGKPPLVGRETVAEHYFEAVYQRAVAMAGALAAAGNLLDDSEGTFTSS